MFRKLLTLLIFYFFVKKIQSYDLVDCSTSSTYYMLHANTTAFLETPSFPQTISQECKTRLVTASNYSIWVALLNGAADLSFEDGVQDTHTIIYNSNDIATFMSKTNVLNFTVDTVSSGLWTAVEAAAVSFDPSHANYTCPLSGQTFDFTSNPTKVIPLRHSFYKNNYDIIYKNCNWNFTTNSATQLLKIVVRIYSFPDQGSSLSLNIDGDIVKNSSSDREVFYFNGSNANLKFINQGTKGSFFILVSAVPEFEDYTSVGCSVTTDSYGNTLLTNGNFYTGYPRYQHCENTFIVPENYESALTLIEDDYEKCCDTLTFIYDGHTRDFDTLILTSAANGSQLRFNSDGNTQLAGYQISVETYKCECADPNIVLKCDSSVEIYHMKNTQNFCNNITCEFKILGNNNCPNANFYLDFDRAPYSASVNLTVDGNLTQINNYIGGYYSQKSNITLKFTSAISSAVSSDPRSWGGSLKPFAPNLSKFNLNETNTKHLLMLGDMKNNDAVTVCATSGTLEIYVSQVYFDGDSNFPLANYQLFDGDENRATFFHTLDDVQSNTKESAKSSTGCFTVYLPNNKTSDTQHMVLFKIVDKNAFTNCGTNYTVLQIYGSYQIGIDSSSAGPCTTDFFAAVLYDYIFPVIRFQSIATNSNSTVSFSSIVNKKLLFSLNSSEASEWKDFDIYTPGLTMILPPSSSVTMVFNGNSGHQRNTTHIIQKGITTSPSYNGLNHNFKSTVLYQSFYNYYFKNLYQVTFSFKEKYGNPNVVISSDTQNITLTSDTTTIQLLYSFQIIYEEKDFSKNGFLIEYIINRTAIDETTVVPTSTTTNFPFNWSSPSPTTLTARPPTSTTRYYYPTQILLNTGTSFSHSFKILLFCSLLLLFHVTL